MKTIQNTLKSIALTVVALLAVIPNVQAQNVGEAFYIYRNDGHFNAFFRAEVDSMAYSYYDADSVRYDEIVTQLVYTEDSLYRIPIAAIDSVSFVQPETKYVSTVVHMQPLLPYIVSVDGLIVNFASNIPPKLMPKVGDILLQDNFDSDKLPDGFAGKVIQVTGQKVICESVSFEDIYERIVCYGSYTAVNDEASNSMRLAPRNVVGGISTAIGIKGTVGSTGTGVYGTVSGQLGMDLRVTFNYAAGKPTYFDLSLAPNLSLALTAGVKLQHSGNNVLSNKVNLIAIPIPDTPFLLKLKAGPVLKYSVDASVTISTKASLGYKFGVKYEDGSFKGYGKNTSKWFSAPDVNGHISGSLFGGIQTEFGIFSYGDLLSLSLEKEAGAEFVANLTTDLLNSDKYEELQNAQFDLNLKASVGVSAKAQFFKWASASANWNLLSGELNINSWKLVPMFQKPIVNVNNSTSATISVVPSEKLLFPVSIGLGVFNSDDVLADAQYCPNTYRVFENWGLPKYETIFNGLTPNSNYIVKPLVKLLGVEVMAKPNESFQTKDIPVKLSNFKVINSQYQQNGFSHNGQQYDYRFDVSITATLDENVQGVSDWGYAYLDPNGNEVLISLKSFGSSYTDTRYAYFRNQAHSTCTLYGYVKYAGSDEIFYGVPTDYELNHGDTSCPDANHPHMIDLGLPSGTKWACCNVGATTPEGYGNYYAWGETSPKSSYGEVNYAFFNGYNDVGNLYPFTPLGDIAGTQYDAATANWGAPWRMPSVEQIWELRDNCSVEWTAQNGVNGRKFTGPNGGTIFLPAAGWRNGTSLNSAGSYGDYWSSSSPYPSRWNNANYFSFYSGRGYWGYEKKRSYGASVRPVLRN